MRKVSDFEVFQKMSDGDLDIRVSNTLVETKSCKQGGLFTMGVDANTHHAVTLSELTNNPKYYTLLYVINKEQYDKIKTELQNDNR